MSAEAIVVILSNVAIGAFVYGRLTERVKNHSERIEDLENFTGLKSHKVGAGK